VSAAGALRDFLLELRPELEIAKKNGHLRIWRYAHSLHVSPWWCLQVCMRMGCSVESIIAMVENLSRLH
jgi:hypothetical protein